MLYIFLNCPNIVQIYADQKAQRKQFIITQPFRTD